LGEGIHPRVITDGYELARKETLKFLETFRHEKVDKMTLINVARTALSSKLQSEMANLMVEIVVDAVLLI
jgi:T-complex protein 1 subunit zeta